MSEPGDPMIVIRQSEYEQLLDPVSIWQGELQMSGVTLHVHVLSDGTRIIEADDLAALINAWERGVPVDEAEADAFARWQRGES